jgi:S-adenosylmethionine-diacylglycerol 3-amino-3-carboxypropyl transferase
MEEKNLKADFSFVRYANCWEDADILLKALHCKDAGNFLSIASAGDNSLSLLTLNPNLVLAFDINSTQLGLTELKKAVFQHFSYEETLQFLGVLDCIDRKKLYDSIKSGLSKERAAYWDAHPDLIEKGIIHIGKFENYFRLFRTYCLPLIHSKKTTQLLLGKKSEEERHLFYSQKWNNFRWKLLFRIFFGKTMMGKLGRDPEFFKYVDKDVGKHILARVEHGLTTIATDENPYLEYILKGNFQNSLPHYLRKENFQAIKQNIHRLQVFQGDLSQTLQVHSHIRFCGFNLSDIFEYMIHSEYVNQLEQIIRSSTEKGKIAFWNMLCNRGKISNYKIKFLDEESAALLEEDKAFFYQSFVLGEVQ